MTFRPLFATLSGVFALTASALTFSFDTLNSGDAANLASQSGIHFQPAVFAPDLDADGIEIPGTERWRVDVTAPPVLVGDPQAYGGGPAPSPSLALDAFLQPILVVFPTPSHLRSFHVTLDGNSLGDVLDAFFLDSAGQVRLSLSVDQTQPYFRLVAGPLDGVSAVVLPAGAFYDNLSVAAPEVNSHAAGLAAGLIGAWGMVRRKAKQT